jgi:hypothetical protein
MDREEFLAVLGTGAEFTDLGSWRIERVGGGLVSANTYRLRRGDHDYFVKEVVNRERDVLRRMIPLGLQHVPRVAYPDLLDRNILVTPFIPGGPIASKLLDPGLVRDFATVQNRLTEPPATDEARAFFRDAVLRWQRGGTGKLAGLRERVDRAVLAGWEDVAERLTPGTDDLAEEFAAMPFARQHHDLREANILTGPPQTICDWGSSYGAGPFFFDMAPFCLRHPENLEVYAGHSDICRAASPEQVERWMHVGAVASLWSRLNYIHEFTHGRDPGSWLCYEFQTWRLLAV